MRIIAPCAALLAACATSSPTKPPADAHAAELHKRAIVVDAHSDITEAIVYAGYDFAVRHPESETSEDLPRLREGGLDAQIFAIWINPERFPKEKWFAEAEHELQAAREALGKVPGMALARTAREVRENEAKGITSALFGVEGGYMLEPGTPDEQLAHLRRFAELGARYLTLTHGKASSLGGSSTDELSDGLGLTDFGRRALEEMDRLGVVIDLSHVSDPLFWDAIRAAKKPVIASHSSSRTLANVPRNLTDAMVRAVGKNGGAVCVNFYPGFLDRKTYDETKNAEAELEKAGVYTHKLSTAERRKTFLPLNSRINHADIGTLSDHIVKLIELAGPDHVCLGSDFDGIPFPPRGLEDASKLPALTQELVRRGLGDETITKLLGGNLLRVLEANEAH